MRRIWILGMLALGSCGHPNAGNTTVSGTGREAVVARTEAPDREECVAGDGFAGAPAGDTVRNGAPRPDRVEVLSFHGRRRCATCRAIEQLTRQVVEEEFARQVADGQVVLRVVEIEREQALAERYEVAWSSLLLHGSRSGADTVVNLTRRAFDTARKRPEAFRETLRREIANLLMER